jgi:hypothetical protein
MLYAVKGAGKMVLSRAGNAFKQRLFGFFLSAARKDYCGKEEESSLFHDITFC